MSFWKYGEKTKEGQGVLGKAKIDKLGVIGLILILLVIKASVFGGRHSSRLEVCSALITDLPGPHG